MKQEMKWINVYPDAGVMEDILGNKYSKSTISRITDLTIEEVYKFVNRPLDMHLTLFL